jgi:hypothetical protein
VLSQQPDLREPQHCALYETCLDQLVNTTDTVENMENQKLLIRHLYKERKMEKLTRTALSMAQCWPESSYPLEWICKAYIEWAADTLGMNSHRLPNPNFVLP